MEEIYEETGITLPRPFLPGAGALLITAGVSLLLWSDILVDLAIALLGVLALLLGLGFFLAGHFLGRSGIPSILLFIAGLFSILSGILALLRRDLVLDLIIYLGAAMAILAGLFLVFMGSLLSVRGPVRRGFLGAGGALLITGVALALFPGPVARFLLAAGGAVLAAAGCAALLFAFIRGRGIPCSP
jgi:hypothetical protein